MKQSTKVKASLGIKWWNCVAFVVKRNSNVFSGKNELSVFKKDTKLQQ